MELASLYRYITPDDRIETLGAGKAELTMQTIAPDWTKHEIPWGFLYTEVHPWFVSVDDLGDEKEHPHILRDGRKLKLNELASRFFGFKIFGTCFIHAYLDVTCDLGIALNKAKGATPSHWY